MHNVSQLNAICAFLQAASYSIRVNYVHRFRSTNRHLVAIYLHGFRTPPPLSPSSCPTNYRSSPRLHNFIIITPKRPRPRPHTSPRPLPSPNTAPRPQSPETPPTYPAPPSSAVSPGPHPPRLSTETSPGCPTRRRPAGPTRGRRWRGRRRRRRGGTGRSGA